MVIKRIVTQQHPSMDKFFYRLYVKLIARYKAIGAHSYMSMPNIKERLVYKSRNEKGRMNGDATGGLETKLRRIDRLHMSTSIVACRAKKG